MSKKFKSVRPQFKGVIYYPLGSEDDKYIDAMVAQDNPAVDVELIGLIEQGYSVTYEYDKISEDYRVILKCNDSDNENAGWWLIGNGESLLEAMCVAHYRHFMVFEGGQWDTIEMPKRKRR